MSRPVWGAWIEISQFKALTTSGSRRAPYGARGLKSLVVRPFLSLPLGRAPYGARGLKSLVLSQLFIMLMSRPVWGAWIEMTAETMTDEHQESRPVWGAWIEIFRRPLISIRN